MKKLLLSIVLALCAASVSYAQNTIAVSANLIQGLNGALMTAGSICFQGTDQNNNNITFQVGGGGAVISTPFCTAVTSGAISTFNIPNPANTSPVNIRYHIQIKQGTRLVADLPGVYMCIAVNACTTPYTFNFDDCLSSGACVANPLPIAQGPAGPPGISCNFRGTYSAGTTYAQNDCVIYSGNYYASLVSSNTGNTPASSPTDWVIISGGGGGGGAVSSVFSRTGAVTAQSGDYSYSQISSTPTLRYQTVDANGSAQTQRPTVNLISGAGATVSCTDNSGATRTDCTVAVLSPNPVTPVQSGLIADYRALPGETIGSLIDYSGNGNTATGTVGTAPTIGSGIGGVVCTANGAVKLPTGLNSALSIMVFMSYQGAGNSNTYNSPIGGNGNVTTSNATQLVLTKSNTNTAAPSPSDNYHIWTYANNTIERQALSIFNGIASLAFTMDSPYDRIFINGQEEQLYYNNGTSAGAQTAGFYQICGAAAGSGNTNQTYFTGTVYEVLIYSSVLTPSQVAANDYYLHQAAAVRGITPGGLGVPTLFSATDQNNTLATVGDSITGAGNLNPYPQYLNYTNWPSHSNQAIGGITMTAINADANIMLDSMYRPNATSNVATIFACTNDSGVVTAANCNAFIRGFSIGRRQVGWKVLVTSMLDRSGGDTYKNQLGALMRQTWKTYADGFIDGAGSPLLGCDGCNANANYFSSIDMLHPTQYSQANILAPMFNRALQRAYSCNDFSCATIYTTGPPASLTVNGATESTSLATYTTSTTHGFSVGDFVTVAGVTPSGYNDNCGITAVTTNTFNCYLLTTGLGSLSGNGTVVKTSQADGDKYIILGGSASTQNFTLETCVGYTGQQIHLKATDTNSWTVTPWTGETIDGASTLTMATGTQVNLESQLISASAAGCNWITVPN